MNNIKSSDKYKRANYSIACELQFSSQSVYADMAGVKTPEAVFKGLFHSAENRYSSEHYLLNFKPPREQLGLGLGVGGYRNPVIVINNANKHLLERENSIIDKVINLLPPTRSKTRYEHVVLNRRSLRSYSGKKTDFQTFSNMVYYSMGPNGSFDLGPALDIPETIVETRMYGSGGSLFPVDVYFYINNVDGLEKGLYKYQHSSHTLLAVNTDNNEDYLRFAEFGGIEVNKSNFSAIYVYRMLKNTRKYGDIGLTYGLIEIGAIAQNLALSATMFKHGVCDLGGFNKKLIEKKLSLDGLLEHVMHMTIVGGR